MQPSHTLLVAYTPPPNAPTLCQWRCEAWRMGFRTRGEVLRLCWQRWYWREVEGRGAACEDWESVE